MMASTILMWYNITTLTYFVEFVKNKARVNKSNPSSSLSLTVMKVSPIHSLYIPSQYDLGILWHREHLAGNYTAQSPPGAAWQALQEIASSLREFSQSIRDPQAPLPLPAAPDPPSLAPRPLTHSAGSESLFIPAPECYSDEPPTYPTTKRGLLTWSVDWTTEQMMLQLGIETGPLDSTEAKALNGKMVWCVQCKKTLSLHVIDCLSQPCANGLRVGLMQPRTQWVLGYIIGPREMSTDPTKVTAVTDCLPPRPPNSYSNSWAP